MNKIAKFFKDARSIWVGIFGLFVAAAWAGDTRWVQKADYMNNQRILIKEQINREVGELKIKLLYAVDPQQKAMIKGLIIHKQTQVKNIRGN